MDDSPKDPKIAGLPSAIYNLRNCEGRKMKSKIVARICVPLMIVLSAAALLVTGSPVVSLP